MADDARAVGAYTKAGFIEEGRLRAYSVIEGKVHDELVMAAYRDDDIAAGSGSTPDPR